jgi:hypothetical protein
MLQVLDMLSQVPDVDVTHNSAHANYLRQQVAEKRLTLIIQSHTLPPDMYSKTSIFVSFLITTPISCTMFLWRTFLNMDSSCTATWPTSSHDAAHCRAELPQKVSTWVCSDICCSLSRYCQGVCFSTYNLQRSA